MFKNLTDFSYKRNWKESIGFYLAYLLVGIVLGAIAGGLYGMYAMPSPAEASFSNGFNSGVTAGTVIAVVYCLIVSVILLKTKKLYKNFGYVLLALLGVLLSIAGGSLLGIIIPAIMTTRENHAA